MTMTKKSNQNEDGNLNHPETIITLALPYDAPLTDHTPVTHFYSSDSEHTCSTLTFVHLSNQPTMWEQHKSSYINL